MTVPLRRFAAATGMLLASMAAQAQDWPTRPLTMVIPFAAGGAPDLLGRILAPHLAEQLGQSVIIENAGGAGGKGGAGRVSARSSVPIPFHRAASSIANFGIEGH